jgi:carbon storage regulator
MLVLSRRLGERICIGDAIVVTVVRIHGEKVRLGIDAPLDVPVHREEVFRRVRDRPRAPIVADAATSIDPTGV